MLIGGRVAGGARVGVLMTLLLALGMSGGTARAAGVTTHAFMAERAIPLVQNAQLHALLVANENAVVAGAHYPDGGYAIQSYVPGSNYSEVSHWEHFIDAAVAHLRARTDCGPLTAPSGPCAPEIAFLMGAAAHGMGDEMWDWLFEPRMKDWNEPPAEPLFNLIPALAPTLLGLPVLNQVNTPEFSMDMVALVEDGRLLSLPLVPPPFNDFLKVYAEMGRSDITLAGLIAGDAVITAAVLGERGAALTTEYARVKKTMPRSAASYLNDSGGVNDVAGGIAPYMDSVWTKLTTGSDPAPRVAAVHPEPGETGVPYVWQPQQSSPGPAGGGHELRIIAVLANAVDPSTVTTANFKLTDPHGNVVPQAAGFPKPGPYGAGDGTHSMMIYPAGNLQPCTTYTATLGTGVTDLFGVHPIAPYAWTFKTRSATVLPCL
jgi:hypothetical protein